MSNNELGDAEKEVLAEGLCLNHVLQIAIRCADDAHVDRNLLAASQPLDDTLLKEAQHLRLHGKRHVAELVQEEGASLSRFDFAFRTLVGAGERAFLVAKQLAFDKRLGDRVTVDRNERLVRARRQVMDGARDDLLAGAALTLEQAGQVGRGDLFDLATDFEHDRVAGHQTLERRLVFAAQLHVLHFQVMHLKRALNDEVDGRHVQRLLKIVVGALAHGTQRVFLPARLGRDDDLRVLIQVQ